MGAAPVVREVEVRRPGSRPLLGLEPPPFGRVGGVRVDNLVETSRQPSKGACVVLAGQVHEVLLSPLALGSVNGRGQPVDRPDDDARLGGSTRPSASASRVHERSASSRSASLTSVMA